MKDPHGALPFLDHQEGDLPGFEDAGGFDGEGPGGHGHGLGRHEVPHREGQGVGAGGLGPDQGPADVAVADEIQECGSLR